MREKIQKFFIHVVGSFLFLLIFHKVLFFVNFEKFDFLENVSFLQTHSLSVFGELLPSNRPFWDLNSLPFKPKTDRPVVAIIIDDMGGNKLWTRKFEELSPPITFAYLTYIENLQDHINGAVKNHEVLLHVPMESRMHADVRARNIENPLLLSYNFEKVQEEFRKILGEYYGYVGANNHTGGLFTASLPHMKAVLEVIQEKEVLWLDSVTIANSQGEEFAKQKGIPFLKRDIFLDHYNDVYSIQDQLEKALTVGKDRGYVIIIGHPRPLTYDVLKKWFATQSEFEIVPLTYIYKTFYYQK